VLLAQIRLGRIIIGMYTIAETGIFTRFVSDYWGESERASFCAWISVNPDVGDVIPGSGGCRKVRWSRAGMGKRGGVRIIYFKRLENGTIWLLTIYGKNMTENISAHVLKAIKESIDVDR
jgi:hypothetical protein